MSDETEDRDELAEAIRNYESVERAMLSGSSHSMFTLDEIRKDAAKVIARHYIEQLQQAKKTAAVGCVNCSSRQTLDAVRTAILKYYAALDRRKHGGDAAGEAFEEIQDAMGMQWEPGATLKKQSTTTQPRR